MNKSILLAIFIALIAVGWVFSGYIFPSETSEGGQETVEIQSSEQPVSAGTMRVRVKTLQADDYIQKVHLNGRSQASKDVTLRAETNGQVKDIFVQEGEPIKKGQAILRIDVREREQRVKEAQELVKQREIEFKAAKRLIDQGYASEVRLAETESAFEAAKAGLTQARIDLDKTTIRAPFNGVLGQRYVDIGDYLQVGTEVTDIVDLDPLKVTVFVNEKEVLKIQKDGPAMLKFSNGEKREGHVAYIAPAANKDTRTFQVDVNMDNAENTLPAGLTAQVEIAIQAKQAYQIPPSIITLNDAGDVGVKVVSNDGFIQFNPIEILESSSDFIWVKGLQGTPRVVIVGQDFVTPDQKVEAVEE